MKRIGLSIMMAWVMTIVIALAPSAHAKTGAYEKNTKKHALLVMDADTGKVLYHEKGYSQRFPASLTKMMTLYMTFEALRKGKIKKSTRMKVSKQAAKQPQTNISLKRGSTITVDQAIRALVVRSANDAAVVLGEKMGGSTSRFARMMTAKARALGMKKTQFKNPHGLPNKHQYTTAYDMGLLGRALRRDFPQYYGYFKVKHFSYRGKQYKSHNRVMGMYDGVDGIKTGYIRASGFNLVSSVKKDGFNIVSVVLGAKSSRARDAYMVSVLERTFAGLQRVGSRPRMIASAPVPRANPRRTGEAISVAAREVPSVEVVAKAKPADSAPKAPVRTVNKPTIKVVKVAKAEAVEKPLASVKLAAVTPAAKAPSGSLSFSSGAKAVAGSAVSIKVSKAEPVAAKNTVRVVSASKATKGTLDYQLAKLNKGAPTPKTPAKAEASAAPSFLVKEQTLSKGWGIQVGAFRDKRMARDAVSRAFRLVQSDVGDSAYITIASQDSAQGGEIHRARLANLSKSQAFNVCSKISATGQSCFALPVN